MGSKELLWFPSILLQLAGCPNPSLSLACTFPGQGRDPSNNYRFQYCQHNFLLLILFFQLPVLAGQGFLGLYNRLTALKDQSQTYPLLLCHIKEILSFPLEGCTNNSRFRPPPLSPCHRTETSSAIKRP